MSLPEVLDRGRAAAEARMTDTCIIRRRGAPVFDPDLGEDVEPAPETIYSGKCRVQVRDVIDPRQRQFGGEAVTTYESYLHVPLSVRGVKTGDEVEITAVGAQSDPELVGAVMVIRAPHRKTDATARRFPCEEVARAG